MFRWSLFAISFILLYQNAFTQKPPKFSKTNTVDVTQAVLENIDLVRSLIKQFGFDHLQIPTVSETIYKEFLFIRHAIALNLTDGYISGAAKLDRAGKFYLKIFSQAATARFYAKVHFKELQGKFNYSYSTSIYSDKGVMDARMQEVTGHFTIDYRLDTLKLENPKLRLDDFKNIRVDMGDAIINTITDAVANAAIPLFRTEIKAIAEKTAVRVADDFVEYANKNMNQWMAKAVTQALINTADFISYMITEKAKSALKYFFDSIKNGVTEGIKEGLKEGLKKYPHKGR